MAKTENGQARARRGTPADARSDEELVFAIAASRDCEAFKELFSRHQQAAYNLACYIAGSRTLGEEAVQEAMLRLWTSAKTFKPTGNARTWLLRIVVREALRSINRQRRHARRAEVDLDAQAAVGEDAADAGGKAVDRELLAVLRGQLEHLEPVQRTILAMYYSAGLSQEEIAGTLGVTQQTVSKKLSKTLDTLRRGFAQAGYAAGAPLLGGDSVGAALFPAHPVPDGFADRLVEKVGGGADLSRRAAAVKSASALVWTASFLAVAAAGGTSWWLVRSATSAAPAVRKGPEPVRTGTPSEPAESADDAPRTITWDFTKKPPKDFTILFGNWTWKETPAGGAVEIAEETFIVLPCRVRPRPMVIETAVTFYRLRDKGLAYGCSWLKDLPDRYVQLAREVYGAELTVQVKKDLPFNHYVFGRNVVGMVDGQLGYYCRYPEPYPGDYLVISCENVRMSRIRLRELDAGEIPESCRNFEKTLPTHTSGRKTYPDHVKMKAPVTR